MSNGHSHSGSDSLGHQRSFSSILSPSLPATTQAEQQDPLAKPFVYTREFLISLYDEDKASRRPIELAVHETATKDGGGKPWALREWRDGEKEVSKTVFSASGGRQGYFRLGIYLGVPRGSSSCAGGTASSSSRQIFALSGPLNSPSSPHGANQHSRSFSLAIRLLDSPYHQPHVSLQPAIPPWRIFPRHPFHRQH
jgi:hypothetical protein